MFGPNSLVGTRLAVNSVFRRVALLGIASVVSGVFVGGVLGRVVMRISAVAAGPEMVGRVTENGNRVGEFTVGGTLILLVFVGGFAGVAGSILVAGSDPWLKWMGPVRGVGFGLVALAATGGGDPFSSDDFLILDPPALNVAMFVGLHFVFGFAVSGVYWLLDRKLPPAADREQVGYLVVTSLAILPLLLVIALFTVPSFCGCEPAYEIVAIILVMVGSTVIRHASSFVEAIPVWLARTATITGYGSLALLLAIGLSRNIAQIQQIL
jgi:hypothetical protein